MIAALCVLAAVAVALVIWNVALQAGTAEEREASSRAVDNLVRSVLADLARSRKDLEAERATHVAQLQTLLAQQADERERLITAVLQPDERISLAKLGIQAGANIDIAKARAAHDELILAQMERGRTESRFVDVDGS
jgi:hypothetical protein